MDGHSRGNPGRSTFLDSFGPTFWIGLDADTSCDVARLVFEHESGQPFHPGGIADKLRRAVKVCVYTEDRRALLADLAGEIAAAGYTVVEVRSYVSKDSMSALVFWMQPAFAGTRQNRTTFNTIQARLQKAVATGKVSVDTNATPARAPFPKACGSQPVSGSRTRLRTCIR